MEFVAETSSAIVGQMSSRAQSDGWHIDPSQHTEWETSVGILKTELAETTVERVKLLRTALEDPKLNAISDVVFEYNLKRRGLRIDAVLLAPGVLIIVEFKRNTIGTADREQIMNYCINLREFHQLTRDECEAGRLEIVPILALTQTEPKNTVLEGTAHLDSPWNQIVAEPFVCGPVTLRAALVRAIGHGVIDTVISREKWIEAPFSPSSTILDAAISLYGQHDVSAIREHAVPISKIEACVKEVRTEVEWARANRKRHVILISGTPGSGKTLVGLTIAFDPDLKNDAVFVTGNAPLVDVLNEALRNSYRTLGKRKALEIPAGYTKSNARYVLQNATFKITKAHHFLGERGAGIASSDGSVVIFDEAQRTYRKGRMVLNQKLRDHEADLIMDSLERSYETPVIVGLLGHNQAINTGERGAIAWLEAAERRGWTIAVSDDTLRLGEFESAVELGSHSRRRHLCHGHLAHSLRFYRNAALELWADHVLSGDIQSAKNFAAALDDEGHTIYLCRDLCRAKAWLRSRRVGSERIGMIASSQGRRLAAEGLYVDQKPDIAKWMLAASDDIRGSNMLETVQNQYQIQGLELDYTLVAWDADLRYADNQWVAYKIRGSRWVKDRALDISKNSYRVLLTRARKGMILYVPCGDESGFDGTRSPEWYDVIASMLLDCGARDLPVK